MRAVRTTKIPRRKSNSLEKRLLAKGFELKRTYDINPFGLEVILGIMKDNNLGYETKLHEVTFKLVKVCCAEKRELYQIEYTLDILKILNHIKNNRLLDEKDGD